MDPLAYMDAIMGTPVVPTAARRAIPADPVAMMSPYTPEQEDIKHRIIRNTLSGLSYAAGSIDKILARQVRGALGGKPRELLSILPFSDTLGITRPEDVVTGGDLLGTRDKPGIGNRVAEFATEVLLDPTTYLTLGGSAITKGGKALEMAGLADDVVRAGKAQGLGKRASRVGQTTADVLASPATKVAQAEKAKRFQTALEGLEGKPFANISQDVVDSYLQSPVGGIANFGIPFRKKATLGTGQGGQKIANAMDVAAERLAKTRPVLAGNRLFEAAALQAKTFTGQGEARELADSLKTARDRVYKLSSDYALALKRANMLDDNSASTMRQIAEYRSQIQGLSQQYPEIGPIVEDAAGQLDELLAKSKEIGVPVADLQDTLDYWPRFVSDMVTRQGRAHIYKGFDPSQLSREEYLKHWDGPAFQGTESLKHIIADPQIEAIVANTNPVDAIDQVQDYILTNFGDSMIGQNHPKGQESVARSFARFIVRMGEDRAAKGGFGNHPLADWTRRMIAGEEAYTRTKHIVDFLGDSSKVVNNPPGDLSNMVSVREFLNKNGTIQGGRRLNIANGNQDGGALAYVANKLGLPVTPGMDPDDWKQIVDQLDDWYLPRDVADDFQRFLDLPHHPDEVKGLLKLYDDYTTLFKVGVLTAPARYVRDFTSAIYQNWLIGGASRRGYQDAKAIVEGRQINALDVPWVRKSLESKGLPLTQDLANDEFKSLLASMQLIDVWQGPMAQAAATSVPRPSMQSVDDLLNMSPGNHPLHMSDIAKTAVPKSLTEANPINTRGVGDRSVTRFAPAKAGEDASYYVETINRVAPFITLLRKGYDPSIARVKVSAAQVDYRPTNFTPFEREYLTRIFPFYRFTRKQIPFQIRELMEKPGGKVAQTMRGITTARSNNEALPEHISQTAAIPVGGAPEGFQRFVTGVGLPMEDVFGLFRPGTTAFKTMQGTLQEFLGRVNPLPKSLVELGSGVQMFSGRDMQDLRGTLSDIAYNTGLTKNPPNTPILLEHALASSPLSRVATSFRTAVDPRKGMGAKAMQLLTGIRFTDTDLAKAENLALRNYLEDMLRQDPNVRRFSHLYAPDDETLSPKNKELMSLYRTLASESAKKSRAEKAKQN